MIKEKINIFEDYEKLFYRLKNNYRFSRLCKVFKTKTKKYVYDTGTGKVLEITENMYEILECLTIYDDFNKLYNLNIPKDKLLESLNEMFLTIKSEHIFKAPPVISNMKNSVMEGNDNVFNELQQLQLELTEKCNLRCDYCIYNDHQGGFRNFGTKDLSFDIAKKALDYFYEHSEEEINLSFYGGEPLLNFPTLKKCVDYVQENFKGRQTSYSMTTNATLITKEIADYLSSINNFYITVSLDGPKEVHDHSRKFINKSGSFDKTMQGLNLLINSYGEKAKTDIQINSVITEISYEYFNKLKTFFNDDNIEILKDIKHLTSYVSTKDKETDYVIVDSEEYIDLINESYQFSKSGPDPLTTWSFDFLEKNKYKLVETNQNLFYEDSINKELYFIHNRILLDKPVSFYEINGCCVPGNRRLYVTVNGKYMVCERVGPTPFIGDVDSGIDKSIIEKIYIDDFITEISKYCNDCWAVNLCHLCYMNCFDADTINIKYRHNSCINNREIIKNYLEIYHEILENDPEELDYLNNYVVI